MNLLLVFLAASDLLYAVFPVAFVWKLQMHIRRKIGLSIVLGLSILTFGIALAKLVMIVGSIDTANSVLGQTADVFYIFSVLSLISSVEQNLVIIIGCVPKLHAISKLESSFFSRLRDSFGSLFKSRQTRKSSSTPFSTDGPKPSFNDNAGYSDLEMQPRLGPFDKAHVMETSIVHGNNSTSHLVGNAIHRTDEYAVSKVPRKRAFD